MPPGFRYVNTSVQNRKKYLIFLLDHIWTSRSKRDGHPSILPSITPQHRADVVRRNQNKTANQFTTFASFTIYFLPYFLRRLEKTRERRRKFGGIRLDSAIVQRQIKRRLADSTCCCPSSTWILIYSSFWVGKRGAFFFNFSSKATK